MTFKFQRWHPKADAAVVSKRCTKKECIVILSMVTPMSIEYRRKYITSYCHVQVLRKMERASIIVYCEVMNVQSDVIVVDVCTLRTAITLLQQEFAFISPCSIFFCRLPRRDIWDLHLVIQECLWAMRYGRKYLKYRSYKTKQNSRTNAKLKEFIKYHL